MQIHMKKAKKKINDNNIKIVSNGIVKNGNLNMLLDKGDTCTPTNNDCGCISKCGECKGVCMCAREGCS